MVEQDQMVVAEMAEVDHAEILAHLEHTLLATHKRNFFEQYLSESIIILNQDARNNH